MKKLYNYLIIATVFLSPLTGNSQNDVIATSDNTVARMESNRKTKTPYSVLFKENTNNKLNNIQQLFQKYLGLRSGTDELKPTDTNEMYGNISVTGYQQYFKGIKVEHGAYIATAKNSNVSFISGDFYSIDAATSIVPTLSEDAARTKAWEYMDGVEPGGPKKATGELVFVEDINNSDGKVYLAYKFSIDSRTKALRFEDVYLDAATGKILYINSQIKTGCFKPNNRKIETEVKNNNKIEEPSIPEEKLPVSDKKVLKNKPAPTILYADADTRYSGQVGNMATMEVSPGEYALFDTLPNSGGALRNFTRNAQHQSGSTIGDIDIILMNSPSIKDNNISDNNWTAAEYDNANFDNTAFDAHWGTQRVYDYWKFIHNRNSWDNANGTLKCYVHVDNNFDNAFWVGGAGYNSMFYGDGSNQPGGFTSLTSIDVTAHEIGHGVCQATANLAYNKESGAMNEGFSDIWGAAIERYADPNESDAVPKNYFLIGEEIKYGGGALRSMKNPNLYGQPDTYGGTNWINQVGCNPTNMNDYCGVHTNSGVLNYWFYLVVFGGSGTNDLGNNYVVPSIGWSAAEQITFLGEQNLTPSATYAACRTAMINAATTLFGACSPQVEAVTLAWYAVGVGATYVPCVPTVQFTALSTTLYETVTPKVCLASKTITVGVHITPGASQQTDVTFTTTGGAIAGKDFSISPASLTFPAGSTAVQNVTITIYDDARISFLKSLNLSFTVNANGGNAVKSSTFGTYAVTIKDDDEVPHLQYSNTVNYGNSTANLGTSGIIQGTYRDKRIQHLYKASDLQNFGLKPGTITNIAFNVSTLAGVTTYSSFNMKAGFVAAGTTSITGSFIAGLTAENSIASFNPVAGWNNFVLPTPIVWDGIQNLVIEFCYNNAANSSDDDILAGEDAGAGNNVTAYSRMNSGASNGCTLSSITNSTFRPILRIIETVTETASETTIISRQENLGPNEDVYFYSSAGKIMARIQNLTNHNYGCTTVEVDRTGSGAPHINCYFGFDDKERVASKTFKVTPANNSVNGNYKITLYYTTAEKNGYTGTSTRLWLADNGMNNGTRIIKNPTAISTMCDGIATAVTAVESVGTIGANFTITGEFIGGFSGFGVGVPPSTVLPVTLLSFTAIDNNNVILLNWKVTQQINMAEYVIEYSTNGSSFTSIGTVEANSSLDAQYSFNHMQPGSGNNFYRLKIINTDGSYRYSQIVKINLKTSTYFTITPNPAKDKFTIWYGNNNPIKQISVIDVTGKKIKEISPSNNSGSIIVDASNFAAGIYLIKVVTSDNNIITEKLIKQ